MTDSLDMPAGASVPTEHSGATDATCRVMSPQQQRVCRFGLGPAFQSKSLLRFEADGPLTDLECAVSAVVVRHEALLPPVLVSDVRRGEPRKNQSSSAAFEQKLRDLRDYSEAKQRLELDLAFSEEAGLDAERGPVLAVTLCNLGNGRWGLILKAPSLCGDIQALRIVAQEIAEVLLARDAIASADPEAFRHSQFVEWQWALLSEGAGAPGGRTWRERLAIAPLRSLPFGEMPVATGAFQLRELQLKVPNKELCDAAARHRASLPAFVLTCWQLLMLRLTGQQHTVTAVFFDGRVARELRQVVGLLGRYIPIAPNLNEQRSFEGALRAVEQDLQTASHFQEYGAWEDEVQGSPEYLPIAYDFIEDSGELRSNDIEVVKEQTCFERFSLKLACRRSAGVLEASIQFDPDALEEAAVEHIARAFVRLLDSATSGSSDSLEGLAFIDPVESHHLTVELNDTFAALPPFTNMADWLRTSARRWPDRIAVCCDDLHLSYAEVDREAAALAAVLLARGATAETRVGLLLSAQADAIIAICAILKTGAAYVPVDPSYPVQRIAYVLDDASVALLVSSRQFAALVPEGVEPVFVDEAFRTEGSRGASPCETIPSGCAAYVIYTSGTTGAPKGAVVSHQNIVHSTFARFHYYQNVPASFLLLSSLAFDSSCAGLFWTLCGGGCLVFADPGRVKDPEHHAELVAQRRVTDVLCVPALYKHHLVCSPEHDDTCLRTAIVAGDSFSPELIERHRELRPRVGLYNEYGVTEVSVWSTVAELARAADGSARNIGRAVANTQVYVLDGALQPVPRGVAGELYLGGKGVCRGYWNRPALTAERFVPNPFASQGGSRFYRTGDLARYTLRSDIELLGRNDEQVKVSGYRIELGEIEAALELHPAIADAVVVAETREPAHLVAFVCLNDEASPTLEELRRFVSERLPAYMNPSSLVVVAEIPLTSHGKVDREALRRQRQLLTTEGGGGSPRNEVEAALAHIWCDLLGLTSVGIHDHFVDRGGDSILCLQLVSRAARHGIRLSLKQAFEHPTIAGQAAVSNLEAMEATKQEPAVGFFPLTPIQHWFFDEPQPEPHHYNQSIMLELRRDVDASIIQQALDLVVTHHDALRLRFEQTEAGWRQEIVRPGESVPVECVDVQGRSEEALASIEAEAGRIQASLDLERPLLFRAALFHLVEERKRFLLLVSHHLQIDVVSWQVLLEDLEACLSQLLQGKPVRFLRETASFKAWAEALDEARSDAFAEQEESRWAEFERVSSPALPLDFPGGSNRVSASQEVHGVLSVEHTQALLENSREHSVAASILTCWGIVLKARTGGSSVLINVEGHGRDQSLVDLDVSRTVGWFTTLFPIQLDVSPNDLSSSLRSVSSELARLSQHGAGYGVLRYLGRKAGEVPSAGTPADVCFNYLGQIDRALTQSKMFSVAPPVVGPLIGRRNLRRHAIDVVASVRAGQLHFTITFSSDQFQLATAQGWADDLSQLLAKVACSRAAVDKSRTPAAFPLISATQHQLDRLMKKANRRGKV